MYTRQQKNADKNQRFRALKNLLFYIALMVVAVIILDVIGTV